MAVDPGATGLPPTANGQSLSPLKQLIEGSREDEAYKKDKAYKRFAANIKEALSSFDTNLQDWADYISFLNRLLKAVKSCPSNVTVLPFKRIIAQRLAQCLSPVLPNGVHKKALELYATLFSLIGKDNLARDLALYLPGLASTLSFASLSVKPIFLSIIEDHILPIHQKTLRLALKAIILSLLPGLEEETGDDFDRTIILIDKFRNVMRVFENDTQGDAFFWQCFFLASLTSSSRSQGALAYLTRRLPVMGISKRRRSSSLGDSKAKKDNGAAITSAVEAVISPEPGLLVRSFATGLAHEQILIQRGFLDILTSHLPLDSPILQSRVKTEDLDLLVLAATGIVLRRDTSLNRRLWTWLLGPEQNFEGTEGELLSPSSPSNGADITQGQTSNDSSLNYFQDYGQVPLVRALLDHIESNDRDPSARARPLRICQSLMDRWEVGGSVIPQIFVPAISSVRRYKQTSGSKDKFHEVLRSASVFFDGVESMLIWGELSDLIMSSLGLGSLSQDERLNHLNLVKFVIQHFNLEDDEMIELHIPLAILTILSSMLSVSGQSWDDAIENSGFEGSTRQNHLTKTAADVINMLIDILPPAAESDDNISPEKKSTQPTDIDHHKLLESIKSFYGQRSARKAQINPPLTMKQVRQLTIQAAFTMLRKALSRRSLYGEFSTECDLFIDILKSQPSADLPGMIDIFEPVSSILDKYKIIRSDIPHTAFCALASTSMCLYAHRILPDPQFSKLVEDITVHAWTFLSPRSPKYHVETVRVLWQLQATLPAPDRQIESALSKLLVDGFEEQSQSQRVVTTGLKVTTLWIHTVQQQGTALDSRHRKSSTKIDHPHIKGLPPSETYAMMLTRPIVLLLDVLEEETSALSILVRGWLQQLPSLDKIFAIIFSRILSTDVFRNVDFWSFLQQYPPLKSHIRQSDDVVTCTYSLHMLYNVLRLTYDTPTGSFARNATLAIRNPADDSVDDEEASNTYQLLFVKTAMMILKLELVGSDDSQSEHLLRLQKEASCILHLILSNEQDGPIAALELEYSLIDILQDSLERDTPYFQLSVLDCLLEALKLRVLRQEAIVSEAAADNSHKHTRTASRDTVRSSKPSISTEQSDVLQQRARISPPPQLQKCLQDAFGSRHIVPVLDSWINFFSEILPLYSDTVFQILIPLVECFCRQIGIVFDELRAIFSRNDLHATEILEPSLISYLNGLEQVLARAHDQLIVTEMQTTSVATPQQPQSFIGNMVSGVFASETSQARSATANDRLTVILSFQDAVRICFKIWSWSSSGPTGALDASSLASFNYTSLRMRNRARRMLEHLFAAEPLECIEVIIGIWNAVDDAAVSEHASVFDLLHVLDGSKPKHTIPAIFNSLYSRANPNALDPLRQSTLTSDLKDTDVATFLSEYAETLEDDMMDEIWTDCMAFIKDVLLNPFPHRQTLPSLLQFTAILGEKLDNTTFGEQRKMRRELSDIFMRLLTATFTSKPMGFPSDNYQDDSMAEVQSNGKALDRKTMRRKSNDVVSLLASVLPIFPTIFAESDRMTVAITAISSNVITPTIKSKMFPKNCSGSFMDLLAQMLRLSGAQKIWRKDLAEAFSDPRFFAFPMASLRNQWIPLLRQWTVGDKEKFSELLSRLTPPTTAGIMFGVGAASARLEADRKTQLNLKRIALLMIANPSDTFSSSLATVQSKLTDLITITAASSPSSVVRPELYILIRAMVLRTDHMHLAPLWPMISSELQAALFALLPDSADSSYGPDALLEACKLLDVLLVVAPDEFQLHEWLFVTDTIDAVYRPLSFQPIALADEISNELGTASAAQAGTRSDSPIAAADSLQKRKPLLPPGAGRQLKTADIVPNIIQPFLNQLTIHAFEGTYQARETDHESCILGVLMDLCENE